MRRSSQEKSKARRNWLYWKEIYGDNEDFRIGYWRKFRPSARIMHNFNILFGFPPTPREVRQSNSFSDNLEEVGLAGFFQRNGRRRRYRRGDL